MRRKKDRQSVRLEGYDYSGDGAYFITIRTRSHQRIFGEVSNGVMCCNPAGEMVRMQWDKLTERFVNIDLDEFCVMPDHIHGIIQIVKTEGKDESGRELPDVGVPLVGTPNQSSDQTDAVQGGDDMRDQSHGFDDERDQSLGFDDGRGQPQGIADSEGQPQGIAPTVELHTIGDIVGAFKSITTVEYIRAVNNEGWPPFENKVWEWNYYEHIIRNEKELNRIRRYIQDNPWNWGQKKKKY